MKKTVSGGHKMEYQIGHIDLVTDKETIIKFWEEIKKDTMADKYQWIYEENPIGRAFLICLKHISTNQIVGIVALIQRQFHINGKTYDCAVVGDFLVHPQHRTVGPALMLQRKAIEYVDDGRLFFIYGFPNQKAELILKRTGYRIIGKVLRLTKILKSSSLLKKEGMPKLLAKLVAPILDIALKICSKETWMPTDKKIICRHVKQPDGRFDTFFQYIKNRYMFVADRSKDYIKWKYIDCPQYNYKIFAAFDALEKEVKGYLIYHSLGQHIYIRDFALGKSDKANHTLISKFLKIIYKSGKEEISIRFLENPDIVEFLKKYRFFQRPKFKHVYFYINDKAIGKHADYSQMNDWFMTIGDQDT